MKNPQTFRATAAAILCGMLVWPILSIAEVYKIVGPDGQVSYSDTPPMSKNAATSSAMKGVTSNASASGGSPKLKRGLWEFQRTFVINSEPKSITTQNCTDPISTMTFWKKAAVQVGCTYGETRRDGNRYTQNSTCKIDALNMDRSYTKVLEVSNEAGYVLKETASGGSQPPMSSVTQARRLGDC